MSTSLSVRRRSLLATTMTRNGTVSARHKIQATFLSFQTEYTYRGSS